MKKRRHRRRIDPHAGLRLLSRGQPLRHDESRDIEVDARLAFAAITQGRGTVENMAKLAMVSNLAMLMAEKGIGEECLPDIKAAQAELCDVEARYLGERGDAAKGRIGFTGPGREIVKDMLDVFTQQIEVVTRGTFEWALDEYVRRVDAGLAARRAEAL